MIAWDPAAALVDGTLLLLAAALLDRLAGARIGPQPRATLWLLGLIRAAVPVRWSHAALPAPLHAVVPLPAGATASDPVPWIALWLAGAVACGLPRLAALRRAQRLGRPGSAPGARERRALARAAAGLGLRRVPTLVVSHRAAGPALVGLLRPRVVLPAELLADWGDADLDAVCRHECAHARRRDAARALAVELMTLALWFHPLAWVARRRLATLREIACDERVVRAHGDDAAAYRGTLLRLARQALQGPAPGVLRMGGALRERVARLDRGVPRTRIAVVPAVVLPCLLACVRPGAAPDAETPLLADARRIVAGERDGRGCLHVRFAHLAILAERRGTLPHPNPPRTGETRGETR